MTWPRPWLCARALASLLVLIAAFAYPLRLSPDAAGSLHHTAAHLSGHGRMGESPPSPHGPAAHPAHCLFCLTGAFALPPDPAPAPAPAPAGQEGDRAGAPRAAHGLPRPPRARAPPPTLF